MDAIDKIIEQINEHALEERALYEKENVQKIDTTTAQQLKTAEQEHQKLLEKQLQTTKNKYKQLRSRQQVEVRQETLVEKQGYLDRLFDEAYELMSGWTTDETRDFAEKCLKALPVERDVTLLAGGGMPENIFTEEWLRQVSKELPYNIRLGGKTADQNKGFIVDDQGVQYNFLYRDLLTEVRAQAGNEITRQLFD